MKFKNSKIVHGKGKLLQLTLTHREANGKFSVGLVVKTTGIRKLIAFILGMSNYVHA